MTWFDGVVLGVIGLSTAFAAIRGFSREFASIMAIAFAAVATLYGFAGLAPVIRADSSLLLSVGFGAVLFAVTFLAFWIGFGWIADHIHRGAGRTADRVLGGAFGALRGLALVGLGYLMISYYAEESRQPPAVTEALTFPLAKSVADFFESLAPEGTRLEPDGPASDDDGEEESPGNDGEGSQNALNAPMSPASYTTGQSEGLAEIIATRGADAGTDATDDERRDASRPE
ncbi:MAG: CvpA family protein [Pseudomonadota bacterium]